MLRYRGNNEWCRIRLPSSYATATEFHTELLLANFTSRSTTRVYYASAIMHRRPRPQTPNVASFDYAPGG